jgi:putative flippase GtrA
MQLKQLIDQYFVGHDKKLRFLIAGAINTAVGLGVYPLLYWSLQPMGAGYLEVLIISQILCITFSFITNKYYVFKSKGNLKKEYFKFFAFHGFYFVLNLVCLPILVETMKINPIISQTLFSVAVIVTSYFWHNAVTFKSVKESAR